ncbi:glycosyltransferase [Yoonia sp. SS1-5]|uniref:Glycosyltransferase family 2 protein n=1 Tax=Yoonia rhodophyticola TaxID=3137370 RepID=A0AAN0NM57_9RHOB
MSNMLANYGVVAIGRNEGDRLVRCLNSIAGGDVPVVYVDSGSTDNSVSFAKGLGVEIVDLDMSVPFTAARARNAGYQALVASHPTLEYVQFVDGDCEVEADWLAKAADTLTADPKLGVITGWRSEIKPNDSVYNAICDDEWHAPAGPITACGGDMMVRRTAYDEVGGFEDTVIAAEDDEFCIRIGQAGWTLRRLPLSMTRHDAAIRSFTQWWRRATRAGHGFAQVGDMHAGYFAAPRRRVLLYAGVIPAIFLIGLVFWWPMALGALAIYAASYVKTARDLMRSGKSRNQALHHAVFMVISKFPNMIGFVQYYLRKRRGAAMQIIEYK